MTTEEKAKAYDETLEKIRPLYEQAKKDGNPIWSTYEYLVPKLRESEKPLTPFQQCLNCILRGVYYAEVPDKKVNEFILNVVRTRTDELVKLAKRHEYTDCQLRESEDERIRKYLIKELKAAKSVGELKFIIPQPTREECITYLEKQKDRMAPVYDNQDSFESALEKAWNDYHNGYENVDKLEDDYVECAHAKGFREGYLFGIEKQKEQHIPWYDYQKSKEAGYTIVPNEEYEQLIKQKEQKPAWSEVELLFRGEKVTVKRPFYRDNKGRGYSTTEEDEETAWNALRAWCEKKGISLYDLYPKAGWSEEDADMLNCCISSIEEAKENRYAYKETDGDTSYDREINWLKSLRPSWKPSDKDELMKLKYAGTSTKLD